MNELVLFANPIAGRGRGQAIAEMLSQSLSRQGWIVHQFTQHPEQATRQTFLGDGNVRAVIVIGGDGTIRTVAGRMHATLAEQSDIIPLLIIPMGTANLLGLHLGIQWNRSNLAEQVLATLEARNIKPFDAAIANGQIFLAVAGVGLDATIVHELARIRKGPIEKASYLYPAARALAQFKFSNLTITVDGNPVFESGRAMVFVGNILEYGTGFPLLPMARPDDGQLDLCIIPCHRKSDLLTIFLHAAAGEHLQGEDVIYARGQHILITSEKPLPAQIDGEPAGFTPLDIAVLPGRISFLLPEHAVLPADHVPRD